MQQLKRKLNETPSGNILVAKTTVIWKQL